MKKTIPSHPERQRLKPNLLHPHPLQATYYSQTSKDEDDRLVHDLREHGQRDAIIVVPMKGKPGHYLILDGNRRVSAAEALGCDEIETVIRWDLAGADENRIESEFLRYNSNRRHLHTIDKARIALRLFEIEKKRPRGELKPGDEHEARDRVGKAIGMSGRNLGRYFRLGLTPVEVQNAVRNEKLALVIGEKVSWLSKEQQAEIADRIRGGEKAKNVVSEYVVSRNGRHKKAADAFAGLVKTLKTTLADLEDRPDDIYPPTIVEHISLLERGKKLFGKLALRGRKKGRATEKLAKQAKALNARCQGDQHASKPKA